MHYALQILEHASSTQDIVKDLAWADAPEGIAVQALVQSDGRGRHGRVWVSQEGNLFLSLLLRPDVAAADVGSLALVAGLALHRAVDRDGLVLKWPNDLLLDGKKCAGLLLETDLKAGGALNCVVLGLGVNIAHAPEEGAALGGTLEIVRDDFLTHFQTLYQQWQESAFSSMKEEWLACAHILGAEMHVKLGEDHIHGAFAGLDDCGNLLLDCGADGMRTVTAGEVYL